MAFGKWIGGFFGFINTGSILGAIAGFVLGSLFDAFTDKAQVNYTEDIPSDDYNSPRSVNIGARNDFLFSLMVLAAHMIQADGKIMHSEMEMVRRFLRDSFGATAVTEGNSILLKLFDYRKQQGDFAWQQQIRQSCSEMAISMPEEHRIQLVAFLAEIAKADGKVHQKEVEALKEIVINLSLNVSLVDQMLSLGGSSLEDAYKVLGISPDATDEEVRKAYRRMVIQHHPDKVSNLGEDVKEAATKKLQEINKAKEMIFQARGLS
ncbi:MAG: TerB family tellurite resistance protein [Bacteroidaceae bacterium]|nr:TerB family tellurite resistance protein [Bacteroidaceae bacterium]